MGKVDWSCGGSLLPMGPSGEMPVIWTARELKDSMADLKKLATNVIDELENENLI